MRLFGFRGGGALRKHLPELIAQQRGRCGLCRKRLPMLTDGARVHVDHKVPKSQGGSDDLANLQAVHARCNRIKGGRGEIKAVRRCDYCRRWYGAKRHLARGYCSDRCRDASRRARQGRRGRLGCLWFLLGLLLGPLALLAAVGLSGKRARLKGDGS